MTKCLAGDSHPAVMSVILRGAEVAAGIIPAAIFGCRLRACRDLGDAELLDRLSKDWPEDLRAQIIKTCDGLWPFIAASLLACADRGVFKKEITAALRRRYSLVEKENVAPPSHAAVMRSGILIN